jgi:exonuclease III
MKFTNENWFGTWNVRSLCSIGAIKSVVGELEKYKLDLVGVQEVRWEGEGYQTEGSRFHKGSRLLFDKLSDYHHAISKYW